MQKNDRLPLSITGLSHEGNGVGRAEGMAVFVPRTAPGDEIDVKIVGVRGGHAFGRMEALCKASPVRVDNSCPAFARCGGCALRHISYPAELEAKQEWARENLARIGKIRPECEPIIPSPHIERYRNKASYPVRMVEGRVRVGFFAPRSHTFIPVDDCLLQPKFFADICRTVCNFCEETGAAPYDEARHSGLLRHICIRYGEATGQTLICLVINGKALPRAQELFGRLTPLCPGEVSFHISVNRARTNVILGPDTSHICGPEFITDVLCGVQVRLSAQSFYQVNREAAQLLYAVALEYASPAPGDTLLDLYCGAGTIGLSMSKHLGKIIGVESVPQAVRDARENARINNISGAQFLCADAGQAARELRERAAHPDIAVVDPPRKGLCGDTIEHLTGMSPGKIVYVSCNSATLARDLAALTDRGYYVLRCRAVDLFPRTAHVECVALLEKTHRAN